MPGYFRGALELCNVVPRQLFIVIRIYLLFYDLKYLHSLLTHKWWTIISNEQDWYMSNKRKYDSFKYLWKVAVIFIFIAWIFIIVGFQYIPAITVAVSAVGVNLVFVAMIICFCKMPSIYDAVKIRKEINICRRLLLN